MIIKMKDNIKSFFFGAVFAVCCAALYGFNLNDTTSEFEVVGVVALNGNVFVVQQDGTGHFLKTPVR